MRSTPRKCAILRDPIGPDDDLVVISGKTQGKPFVFFAKLSAFCEKFANHMPVPTPGVRFVKYEASPRVRIRFRPARFGDVSSVARTKLLLELLS